MKKNQETVTTVTRRELYLKVHQIVQSAKQTLKRLRELKSPEDLLFLGKFSSLGTKWDDFMQQDDLGEQVQQSMTMLTTYFAADCFCKRFSLKVNHPFVIHGGDENGPDITFETKDGTVVLGEIFAAKDPYNNNKLFHDLSVLATRPEKAKKKLAFIICCSPESLNENKLKCAKKQIEISAFKKKSAWTDISYKFAGKNGYQACFIHVTPHDLQLWTEQILSRK